MVNFRGALIEYLVRQGVSVYALAPDYSDNEREVLRAIGAKPVDYVSSRTGIQPIADLFRTTLLAKQLRKLRPEVALTYFIKPVVFGTLAAWLARVPRRVAMIEGLGYLFVSDPNDPKSKWLVRNVAMWLYRVALGRAHNVLFLNEDDRQEFIGRRIVKASKTQMVGGIGVNLDKLAFLDAPTKPVSFVFVGRLLREKGLLDFVAAAREVRRLRPDTRFRVLGDIDANPGSISTSKLNEWVSEGLIEWPGHVDVHAWLESSSVFVLPSFYREGVPRSTQEAMAVGRPVITTDMPGCRETVEDGINGFLVPPRDPRVLSEAMMRFIDEPHLIISMGRESRRIAEAKFDEKRSVKSLADALLNRNTERAHAA